MKHFLTAGVLMLCLLTSQRAHAAEDRDAKIKAEMVENYLLWQEAYKLRDAERIISFESPDYTRFVLEQKILQKDDSDAVWRSTMKRVQKVHYARVEIKKLTIEPHRVVVLTNHFFDVDEYWPDVDEELHRVFTNYRLRDIWVKYDRVWMLKRTEQIELTIKER